MARFTNTLLLVLLAILGLTGVLMLYGTWFPVVFDLHRVVGFILLVIMPLKGIVIYRSLRRGIQKSFDRSIGIFVSLGLALLLALVIALALMWIWRIGLGSVMLQTLIAWHWIFGLLLGIPLLFHLWQRWPRPRARDILSRRAALRFFGVIGLGMVADQATLRLESLLEAGGTPLRFSGSLEMGSFTGNSFPLTGEVAPALDIENWHLSVSGAVHSPLQLSYADILRRNIQMKTELLDCTSGWYSIQNWLGLPLMDVLKEAGAGKTVEGVRLVSASGYQHSFPIEEARNILLATHVGGEPLSPEHGFPLRAVVPGRRGWFWVKWLARVVVLENPWEVIAGILESPREVLRQWER